MESFYTCAQITNIRFRPETHLPAESCLTASGYLVHAFERENLEAGLILRSVELTKDRYDAAIIKVEAEYGIFELTLTINVSYIITTVYDLLKQSGRICPKPEGPLVYFAPADHFGPPRDVQHVYMTVSRTKPLVTGKRFVAWVRYATAIKSITCYRAEYVSCEARTRMIEICEKFNIELHLIVGPKPAAVKA